MGQKENSCIREEFLAVIIERREESNSGKPGLWEILFQLSW